MSVMITKEEEQLHYAKYFYRPLAPIPQEKLDIWRGPAAMSTQAMPIEERNLFLDEAFPGLEVGFCVALNGTGFVANSTYMPGTTVEMFDWWFAWHGIGPDLRYKIWDNEDHYYARSDKPEYVRDPQVPLREKNWGVTHDILEDIGFGPDYLKIAFKKPSELGYDMSKIGRAGCASILCGVGTSTTPAIMTHKCTRVNGGIWLNSHFWIGYGMNEQGTIVKLVPDGSTVPKEVPRALFGHNIKEFSNLAAILPEVFAEEKDTW